MNFSIIVYNSVIFIIFLLVLDKISPNIKLYRIIIPIVLFYIVSITGVRSYVGRDFEQYAEMFFYLTFSEGISLSYTSINIILRNITDNYQILFVTVSVIIYYFVLKTYRNYRSIIIIFLWFLLLFFSSLNQIRQGIAMSILFYAIYFINSNKKKYYLYVVLSLSFHMTGFIGFIYPWLSKIKIPYIRLIVIFSPILLYINTPDILDYIGIFKGTYYEFYIKDKVVYASQQPLSIGGIFRLSLPIVFIFCFSKFSDKKFNLIVNGMLLYIIFYLLSINFYILYRIYSLFLILIPIAAFYMYMYKRNLRWFVFAYILGCFVIYQKSIFEQTINPINGNGIYPYQTIFSNKIIKMETE